MPNTITGQAYHWASKLIAAGHHMPCRVAILQLRRFVQSACIILFSQLISCVFPRSGLFQKCHLALPSC